MLQSGVIGYKVVFPNNRHLQTHKHAERHTQTPVCQCTNTLKNKSTITAANLALAKMSPLPRATNSSNIL